MEKKSRNIRSNPFRKNNPKIKEGQKSSMKWIKRV